LGLKFFPIVIVIFQVTQDKHYTIGQLIVNKTLESIEQSLNGENHHDIEPVLELCKKILYCKDNAFVVLPVLTIDDLY